MNLILCELAEGDGVNLAEIQHLIPEKVEKHFSLRTPLAREQERIVVLSNREVINIPLTRPLQLLNRSRPHLKVGSIRLSEVQQLNRHTC